MDILFGLFWGLSLIGTPITVIVIIVRAITKKKLKKTAIILLLFIAIFILSTGYILFDIEKDGLPEGESSSIEEQDNTTSPDSEVEHPVQQNEQEEVAKSEEVPEAKDNEPVITDESDIIVNRIKEDGSREQVPMTRTVDGVKIRTVTTKTEGIGIVKIVETVAIVEGLGGLSEFDFSDDDIAYNEEILSSVGISEVYIKEYIPTTDTMGIAQGLIYDSEGIQLNLTFENNKLFFVELTGIVDNFDGDSSREDKLDLGVGLQGKKNVEMYYDTDGGVLAVLDWQAKTLEKAE